MRNLSHWWHPYLADMVKRWVRGCEICGKYNPKPTVKPHMGAFPLQVRPGEEIVIDYTDMIDRVRGYRYLLVMVESITGWPEAYPAKNEDSKTVIKCLINHYIPQHGFPRRVRSDNGRHFKNRDLQAVEAALGLKHKFGTVYHPESQGKVERMNQNLKTKLAKICAQTKIDWVTALPVALLQVRSSLNKMTGFTPFELLTGRQFPGPTAAIPGEGQHITNFQYKSYFDGLKALLSVFVSQVHDGVTGGQKGDPHTAEWVLLKVIKRRWSEPGWTGPHQVVERTSHAYAYKGKETPGTTGASGLQQKKQKKGSVNSERSERVICWRPQQGSFNHGAE
ncbi:uncharacterized protein K02A2.6-like [Archocentrus centrarchus]|uniref:uncharacterized protein K02A2.6-like n=1 Tax=Archocentrus centrarchus TaxID=63155 RepID=UPI0011E9DA10|nr:uncharacterized protein K02A2.6-like [Archocentrus centrarchus]